MNASRLLEHFDRISEAPDAIPKLRKFILDLAVRGKLVDRNAADDPASNYLERVKVDRLANADKLKRGEAPQPVDATEIPFEIPPGWQMARMGWLAKTFLRLLAPSKPHTPRKRQSKRPA